MIAMKKTISGVFYFTLITVVTLLLVSCQSQDSQSGSNNDDFLEFVTGDPEGTWASIGTGISEKANQLVENTQIISKPGPGSVGNPIAVANGDGDIGMSYNPFLLSAVKGEEPFDEKATNLRAIASLTPTVVHFIQNADMSLDSFEDVISKETKMTLGIPPVGQGSNYIGNMIFSSQGIDNIDELLKQWGGSVYYGEVSSLNDAWSNRQIDGMITTLNVPGSSIGESLTASEGKLMDIGDQLSKTLIQDHGFESYTIPSGTYRNQEKDVNTVGLSIIVFARDDVSDDVIYELTKSIYENAEYFRNIHSSFKDFDPEEMATGLSLEMHPGAEKFYKEKGMID